MTRPAVLLAGGSSRAGEALAEELLGHGLAVVSASRSTLETSPPGDGGAQWRRAADLTDPEQVARLRRELAETGVRIGGIVHLVGGWAGGRGIAGQSDDAYEMLSASFDALRIVTREFHEDLLASANPRVITVSSPLAVRPTPGSANYAAVKAATEAWTLALDASLRAGSEEGCATILVTDSLAGREVSFARLVGDVLASPAARVAGARILHV